MVAVPCTSVGFLYIKLLERYTHLLYKIKSWYINLFLASGFLSIFLKTLLAVTDCFHVKVAYLKPEYSQ